MKRTREAIPNHQLKALRLQRNWTQEQLAERLGTTRINVGRWEHGQLLPSLHFRQKLCDLFETSAEALGLLSEEERHISPVAPSAIVSQRARPANPSPLPPIWFVPSQRNPFFVGREAIFLALRQAFFPARETTATQIQALCGLGGVGKTHTALEYAYRFAHQYQAVLWLSAETREVLLIGIMSLIRLLDSSHEDVQEQRIALEMVKSWLHNHENWLLILDNVQDLDLVCDLFPQKSSGHLLLTTRAQSLGLATQHISLDKMAKEEGVRLLLYRAKLLAPDAPLESISDTVLRDAKEIVQLMDGLPLALDQAGAYIDETGCHLTDYLDRYQTHSRMLLDRRGRHGGEHPQSVFTTFFLAFEQAEQADQAAADLLRICAFLSPDAIPEEIFTQENLACAAELASPVFEPWKFDEALATLRRYSLLKRDAEAHVLTIHPLTQVALKAQMDETSYQYWAEQTVQVVNRAFPTVEEFTMWSHWQRLLSQALQCSTLIECHDMRSVDAGRLLHQTGACLLEYAQYEQASVYLQQAYDMRVQFLGPTHLSVAESLNHLAELLYYQAQYVPAEELHLQALAIRQHQLGANHPDVATSLHNLAGLYWIQGRYREAEPLYLEALLIREETLGCEHLDVAETLQNLAYLYYNQEKYQQAETLYQRAFTICQHVLGEDHAYLTTIFNNMGKLYQAQGQDTQAEAFYHRALDICVKKFAFEHPHRAMILSNFASLYCMRRQYAQAETLYHEALLIREKVLGASHPRTAQTLHDVALLYSVQGKNAEAHQCFQRALTIREQTLGPDHTEVAQTLTAWANCFLVDGAYAQAEMMVKRAQAICEQIREEEQRNSVTLPLFCEEVNM